MFATKCFCRSAWQKLSDGHLGSYVKSIPHAASTFDARDSKRVVRCVHVCIFDYLMRSRRFLICRWFISQRCDSARILRNSASSKPSLAQGWKNTRLPFDCYHSIVTDAHEDHSSHVRKIGVPSRTPKSRVGFRPSFNGEQSEWRVIAPLIGTRLSQYCLPTSAISPYVDPRKTRGVFLTISRSTRATWVPALDCPPLPEGRF